MTDCVAPRATVAASTHIVMACMRLDCGGRKQSRCARELITHTACGALVRGALAAHGASAAVFGAVLTILAVLARFADTVWVAACDHRFCIALCKTGVQRCTAQSHQHGENANRQIAHTHKFRLVEQTSFRPVGMLTVECKIVAGIAACISGEAGDEMSLVWDGDGRRNRLRMV